MNGDVVRAMDELSAALQHSCNESLSVAIAQLQNAIEQTPVAVAVDAVLHLLLIQHRRIYTARVTAPQQEPSLCTGIASLAPKTVEDWGGESQ